MAKENQYTEQFSSVIDTLKKEHNVREFIEIGRDAGNFPYAYSHKTKRNIIVWCSNDYLALGQNPEVIKALSDAANQYGVGAGGTRNIAGNNHLIVELENRLASFHNKEKALIFSSGYIANQTCLATLNKIIPDLVFFSDSCNHASIIKGLKDANKKIFKHNDVEDLRRLLSEEPQSKNKIIVFESVYSMNGNVSPIKEIISLAKEYNALTYIDEVHGVGLYGTDGAGMVSEVSLKDEIDIVQGTFGKAFGVSGGYVTGSFECIEAIRCYAPGFIFTTAMSPPNVGAILKSLEIISSPSGQALRAQLYNKVKTFRTKLLKANIQFMQNNSHITPVVIGDSKRCKMICDELLEKYQIYIQPINYPTVPKKTERLRINTSAAHTEEMMDELVLALQALI